MPTDADEDKIDQSQIVLARRDMEKVADKPAAVEEDTTELPMDELKGLMARRNTDGV